MWKKILGGMVIIGLVIGISLGSQGIAEEKDPALAACWHFDEGEGDIAADSSGCGNNGKIHGAIWVEGIKGKALKFDGKDDYVDCGNGKSLDITDAITIEAWINLGDTTSYNAVVSKYLNAYEMYFAGEGLVFQTNDPDTVRAGGNTLRTVAQWYHVVFTFDKSRSGQRHRLYVNGQEEIVRDVDGNSDGLLTNRKRVTIGARSVDHSMQFNGIIDEVKIYKRALTEGEIKSHYEKIGKIIAEKEKKEKEEKLKALSSLVKESGLSFQKGALLPQINFSIPEGWNYRKVYKKPFYYVTGYCPQTWKNFNIDQEPFIEESLAWIWPNSSSPELLSSDKPIIVWPGGDYLTREEADKIKEDYGERHVATWNHWTGEWTRLWVPSRKYVQIYVKQAGFSEFPKNRKEALEMAGILLKKRWAKYTPGQDRFINVQGSLQDHYAMSLPEIVIEGVEMTGACGQFPAQIASARGASRQYQKPWISYIASFDNKGTTNYLVPFPECYCATGELHYKRGPYFGPSPSLHKRTFYASYMGGANLLEFENDHTHSILLAKYDFRTIDREDHLVYLLSDKKGYLSPVGYDFREFYNNVVLKHDRGIPYTPVGLLFDKYHNLNTPYSYDWGMGMLPYNDGDYMMRAVINSIWHWEGKSVEGGRCMVTSSFGDIFDLVTNDKSTLDNLKNYPVLFMVGNVDIDKTFYNRLVSYVKKGGNLFINIEQVNDLFTEDFLGVKLSKSIHQGSSFYSLLDGEMHFDKEFSFREVIPVNAKPVVISPDYDNLYPLVTVNNYGKGKVFLTTPYYLYFKGSKNKMLNLFSYLMKEISKGTTPVSVEGNVEYLINRNKNGWVLTLINNEGLTKLPSKKVIVDPEKNVEVKITFNKDFKLNSIDEWTKGERVNKEKESFILTVPPGDIRIVEFKGEQL